MSERYTVQENDDALWIYDGDDSMDPGDIAALLNDRDRLAAEVETLRELLREAKPIAAEVGYYDLERRIDAATNQVHQESGDEAAREDA